jgi:hypothetical protein
MSLFIGIERTDPKSKDPMPTDLGPIVQLQSSDGTSLKKNGITDPRATVSGGFRQRLTYQSSQQYTTFAPAKLVISLPSDATQAALPFEFKDVELP